MLVLLVAPYLCSRVFRSHTNPQDSAALGVGMMLILTGSSHFFRTAEMVQMLPDFLPLRYLGVILTGVLELLLAALVVRRTTRRTAAVLTLLMLLMFLPVNLYAAWVKAPVGGHQWGVSYLFVRIPAQFIIAGWIWFWLPSRRSVNRNRLC
ncbi:DoxX family protein [Roseimaritima ulvae]|nr:hypothetical protein [Roseimaritima ulvae]